jgi:hypothetical protein
MVAYLSSQSTQQKEQIKFAHMGKLLLFAGLNFTNSNEWPTTQAFSLFAVLEVK